MKLAWLKNSFWAKKRDKLKEKFGEGFFTVFGICAFLFVMCGLIIGLLGRGWLYAWLFVVLGGVFAVFPVINHLLDNNFRDTDNMVDITLSGYDREFGPSKGHRDNTVDINQKRKFHTNTGNEPKAKESTVDIKRKKESTMESTKAALELEAAIARARLLKEKEFEKKRRAEEERYEADKAAFEARKERERKYQEEKKKKEANQRRIREENAKKQKEFNENYFKRDNIKKATTGNGYFQGVRNSEELKKRYKDLLKIYHPDNSSGDAEITRQIHAEYKELVPFYKAYDKHNN